ncbi:MAG: hypothetical protein CMH58_08610 [Myxococcales bacterium]|nr:hypothetical protein [Myxococcales bacterium]
MIILRAECESSVTQTKLKVPRSPLQSGCGAHSTHEKLSGSEVVQTEIPEPMVEGTHTQTQSRSETVARVQIKLAHPVGFEVTATMVRTGDRPSLHLHMQSAGRIPSFRSPRLKLETHFQGKPWTFVEQATVKIPITQTTISTA